MYKYSDSNTIKFLISSSLGTFLEFLDFAIFCSAANLIANQILPNNSDEALGKAFIWISLAIGFLVRPLGAILFGHIGDKIGCKKTLVISILTMAISTLAIGLIPNYQTIGYFAPLLLLLLRVVQGLSISPEYNGAAVYFSQQPQLKRWFSALCCLSVVSTLLGYVVGDWIISSLLAEYDIANPPQWCWRVPIIMSSICVGIAGIVLRLNMLKLLPPRAVKIPLFTLFSSQKREILACCFLSGLASVATYILLSYLPRYLQDNLDYSHQNAHSVSQNLSLLTIAITLLSGVIFNNYNRLKIMKMSIVALILSTTLLFFLKNIYDNNILLMMSCLAIFTGFYAGPLPAVLVEYFHKEHRYTGAALGHNIGVGWVGAGTAQLGLTLTMQFVNNSYHMVVYPVIIALVTLIALAFLSKSKI